VVRHVEVTGNRLVTAAQVRQAARIRTGAPLATVDAAAAARRVEQLAPVLSATVRRSWPDTIVITVRERTPVFAVAAAGGYQLIDSHGVAVRRVSRKPASMTLLSSPPGVLRGNPAVYAAAVVLRQLPRSLRSRIVSVSAASASSVTLHLAGRITVLWGGASSPAQKLSELGMLLGRHARYYDISDPSTAVTEG
jgi:cell division protein FtsQ